MVSGGATAQSAKSLGVNLLLTAIMIVMILPVVAFFYWLVLISLRTDLANNVFPPKILPTPLGDLSLEHYRQVIQENDLLRNGFNSLVIAIGSTVVGLLLGAPAAYSIARWRQNGLALAILVARIIPAVSYLIPWYVIFSRLGLIDTYTALITTHLIVSLPLVIWILIGFFEDIPIDLEEAARIDGASHFGAFLYIVLPLVRPGIIASAIISLIFSWNNFIFSIVLAGSRTNTLPLAAYKLLNFATFSWGTLAATAVLISLPIIFLTMFVQRYLVTGLTAGGVK